MCVCINRRPEASMHSRGSLAEVRVQTEDEYSMLTRYTEARECSAALRVFVAS